MLVSDVGNAVTPTGAGGAVGHTTGGGITGGGGTTGFVPPVVGLWVGV